MQYFYLSPFFDPTSNNNVLMQQLQYNPALASKITSQEAFDEQMKSLRGVEYVIAAGSQETGVWVVRKQQRRQPREMVVGGGAGRVVEDVSVLATYYVVGENIYQAPSVGSVLGMRMANVTRSLRRALVIAGGAVAAGGRGKEKEEKGESLGKRSGEAGSQETLVPSSTQASSVAGAGVVKRRDVGRVVADVQLMQRAMLLAVRHQGEFMDDHAPLLGDPGSLVHGGGVAAGGGGGGAGMVRTNTPIRAGRTGTPVPVGGVGRGVGKK
jgi:mediator of RNA polymerase II transcription subunit 6